MLDYLIAVRERRRRPRVLEPRYGAYKYLIRTLSGCASNILNGNMILASHTALAFCITRMRIYALVHPKKYARVRMHMHAFGILLSFVVA